MKSFIARIILSLVEAQTNYRRSVTSSKVILDFVKERKERFVRLNTACKQTTSV